MGHPNLIERGYETPLKQRNITCFVGNGFDLQALGDFSQQIDTRYTSFFHFLKMRSFNSENLIFQEMVRLQKHGKTDWVDVEAVVAGLTGKHEVPKLLDNLRTIQQEFAAYLDIVVSSSFLNDLGASSSAENWAINSLQSFLGDLNEDEYKSLQFPKSCRHYDVFSFIFLNFNYTPIFDNYIYLDSKQFDPRQCRWADRNFQFEPNPKNMSGLAEWDANTSFSSYVLTEVFHPHGTQGTARPLLFGTDLPKTNDFKKDSISRLSKHFWAQNNVRHKHLFDNTELYIIFGCSLGESDRWWWANLLDSLKEVKPYDLSSKNNSTTHSYINFQPEVILYWYNSDGKATRESVINSLFAAADRNELRDELSQYVHVVLFDDSTDRVWLNTQRTESA
ncbi:MAG: AbiH family protein [Actinomycetaceae bacterium]|nr:AbiH family protein [Actinomycetaceae bacterium]